MREILFRGKRRNTNEWIYGNLVIDKDNIPHIVPNEYFYEDGHHLQYTDESDRPVFIDTDTVGQYTGIKDKNDKKIFEGDVINFKDKEMSIFDKHCLCVQSAQNGGFYVANSYFLWALREYGEIEVIGNIYGNPELKGGE